MATSTGTCATGPEERPTLLVELGGVEVLVDGPAAVEHLTEAYGVLPDARERARIAAVIARTHVFVSPPGVATAFARDAADALPADLDDERQGLTALQRITGFMHGLPEAGYRSGPVPEVSGEGDGARMLAAALCYELLRLGEDRERAVELARFALAGTGWSPSTPGCCGSSPPTCCCSPTRTSATSGTGCSPARTRPAGCSPSCR